MLIGLTMGKGVKDQESEAKMYYSIVRYLEIVPFCFKLFQIMVNEKPRRVVCLLFSAEGYAAGVVAFRNFLFDGDVKAAFFGDAPVTVHSDVAEVSDFFRRASELFPCRDQRAVVKSQVQEVRRFFQDLDFQSLFGVLVEEDWIEFFQILHMRTVGFDLVFTVEEAAAEYRFAGKIVPVQTLLAGFVHQQVHPGGTVFDGAAQHSGNWVIRIFMRCIVYKYAQSK